MDKCQYCGRSLIPEDNNSCGSRGSQRTKACLERSEAYLHALLGEIQKQLNEAKLYLQDGKPLVAWTIICDLLAKLEAEGAIAEALKT